MRKLLMVAVFLATMLFDLRPAPAQAPDAPWCAVLSMGRGDAYWDCSYASIEACRPNILAGNRGFCNPNPRWAGWYHHAEQPIRHGKRRARHH